MPELLLFTPCQKALIDNEDNSLSVFNVMEGLTFTIPPDTVLAPDAAIAFQWMVITLWFRQADEEGIPYEQRVEIIRPDGSSFAKADITFQMTHRTIRNRVQFTGMPIGQSGEYTLRLSLRRSDKAGRWKQLADYPIAISHNTVVEQPSESEA